ncbi:MAG: amino acid-binding protein [Planctomycetota bacterium]
MSMRVNRETVWVAELADRPGGLAEKLTPLAEAGANLHFVIARRNDDAGVDGVGRGVVFVTPLDGDRQHNAARLAGFHASTSMHGVRVEGPDRAGLGEVATSKLAEAGLNLRGLSAASVDGKCAMHLAFDTEADANTAVQLLKHVR